MALDDPRAALAELRTIGQIVARAREVLEPGPVRWATAGAGGGSTLARNELDLSRLCLVPRILRDVSAIDMRTTFLGIPLEVPVVLAPVGSTVLYHRDSSVAAADGAARAGTSAFCGFMTASSWSDVAATAPGRHVLQVYVLGGRDWLREIAHRAEDAGFAALCVTGDSPLPARRDALVEHGSDWREQRNRLPGNLEDLGRDDDFKPRFTWAELEWLCAHTDLPVVLKGVMHPDDAVRAVDCGARGVYVSNHGGRAHDQGASTISVLEEVVAAVAGRVEVAVDGGFLRGPDVCKALALGARAVGIGRLQCWGLALGGATGVAHVFGILRQELESAMASLGCRTAGELAPDHVRWSRW